MSRNPYLRNPTARARLLDPIVFAAPPTILPTTRLSTPRALAGSLPLNLSSAEGGALNPAILFAPSSLRAKPALPQMPPVIPPPAATPGSSRARTTARSTSAVVSSDSSSTTTAELLATDHQFLEQVEEMLNSGVSDEFQSRFKASSTDASYDFDEYLFLRSPEDPFAVDEPIMASGPRYDKFVHAAENGIAELINYAGLPLTLNPTLTTRMGALQMLLKSWWMDICAYEAFVRLHRYSWSDIKSNFGVPPEIAYGQALGWWLMTVGKPEAQAYLSTGSTSSLNQLVSTAFWEDVLTQVFDNYFDGNGIPQSMGSQVLTPDPQLQRLVDAVQDGITTFLAQVRASLPDPYAVGIGGLTVQFQQRLVDWWVKVCLVRAANRLSRFSPSDIKIKYNLTPERYYGRILGQSLIANVSTEARNFLVTNGDEGTLGRLDTVAFWEEMLVGLFQEPYFNQVSLVDPSAPERDYPFEPFRPDEVLFGLQVIHRQTWHSLGYGRGELVKSIPLGPKESQKISQKITRRRKTTRGSEQATSVETSSEQTSTTKDTSEVVTEASEKFNQHAEAEVSGGYYDFIKAKVSGGLSQDIGTSSKQTKSRLNEQMEKTASRMKRDTKVTVSVEGEESFEETRASELTNPNDEIAVTYLYHRLQQRFWVSTEIAEVYSVVFVPEHLPDWDDITEDWVRRHGEILARALLDQSFAPTLAMIRQEPSTLAYTPTDVFNKAAQAGIDAATKYQSFTGGYMPDLLSSGPQLFERDYERRNSLAMDQARRRHQTEAFLTHIRRNILPYMRAIWSSEDHDQRMQRYSRLRVPVAWYFVPLAPIPAGASASPLEVEGVFMPDSHSARPLSEVIDPIGPIGWLFNCGIYRLRDDPKLVNLHQALSFLRASYMRFAVTVSPGTGADLDVLQSVAYSPRSFSADYTLLYRTAKGWLLQVPSQSEATWPVVQVMSDGSLDVLGIRIWLSGTAADGDTLAIRVRATAELEDPHLRLLKILYPLPQPDDEAGFFTDELLREMVAMLPELATGEDESLEWSGLSGLSEESKAAFRDHYHRFLMLCETGRLVTLDTANVVLDLEISRSPALEQFKRLHRYIDVVKEYHEARRRQLETNRRELLLEKGVLGDPEIERVSLIGANADLKNIINVPDLETPDE